MHLIIDYFVATFPFIRYEDESEIELIDEIVKMICNFLNIPLELAVQSEYAQNRFKVQYQIGENIILRLQGPEMKSGHQSCSIELKGKGCREYESYNLDRTWFDFFEFFIVRLNANPTRIDIAIDDYAGNVRFQRYVNNGEEYCWTAGMIKRIIKEQIYTGDMINHKTQIANYKTRKVITNSKDKQIIVPNTHEAIISKDDFERAQIIISNRRVPRKKYQVDNIFRGIVKCSVCGIRQIQNTIRPQTKNYCQ